MRVKKAHVSDAAAPQGVRNLRLNRSFAGDGVQTRTAAVKTIPIKRRDAVQRRWPVSQGGIYGAQ